MKKKLNLCLIGVGFVGKKYSKVFKEMTDKVSLHTICDKNLEATKSIAEQYGFLNIQTDWHKAISDPEVDFVCICVPNKFHYEIAKEAIKNKKHVFCEKPLTTNSEQSFELARLSHEANVVSSCCYNLVHINAIKYFKSLIDEKELGDLVSFRGYYDNDRLADPNEMFEWRMEKANSIGGSLCDLSLNILSISQYLFGDISSVTGVSKIVIKTRKDANNNIKTVENEDAVHFLFVYKNGAIGSLSSNRVAPGSKQDMGFVAQFTKGSARFSLERMNEIHVYFEGDDGFTCVNSFNEEWFSEGYNELKSFDAKEFIEKIFTNTSCDTDFLFSAKIDKIIESVVESYEKKKWIEM